MNFQNIPATEGVRKIGRGEGEKFDIAGAHLTWKVKGVDTGYAFSICEQTLAPGEGVPLHSHASAEAFYVLSGATDFFRLVNGNEDWVHCETGELMILPPNSLHGFYNRTFEPFRLLGISTPSHQAFFDAVASADKKQPVRATCTTRGNEADNADWRAVQHVLRVSAYKSQSVSVEPVLPPLRQYSQSNRPS